jgi:hypothetical protein
MSNIASSVTMVIIIYTCGFILQLAMAGETGFRTSPLTAAIGTSDTTITAQSTAGFLSSGYGSIGNEIVYWSGKTATTFTGVQRGVKNTAAAPHSSGEIFNSDEAGTINSLIGYDILANVSEGNILDKIAAPVTVPLALAKALANIIAWNFVYLASGWAVYVKYLILYPISAGLVFNIIFGVFRR